MAQTTTEYEAGTLVHPSPTTLLLARNIREAAPSKELIDSIRDHGVLEPITAVLTESGELLVRYGHRRALAAIAAKRETIPVYVAGEDSLDKQAEVRRVITQREENTHRDGLTTSDEATFVETLTGLGLSPAQITKQARIKRADVTAAIAISKSKLARAATARYEALTLDQAALVAEFDDDPETVKALVVAAHEGSFDHAAQLARDERLLAKRREEILSSLTEAGLTVIERPTDDATRRLDRLTVSPADRTRLDKTDHEQCPGHVAWVGADWFDVDANGDPIVFPDQPEYPEDLDDEDAEEAALQAYEEAYDEWRAACSQLRRHSRRMTMPAAVHGCAGWRGHGHGDAETMSGSSKPKVSELSETEREEAKAARKLVIENNKAWSASHPVRRAWLATFAKAKSTPKGTGAFLVTALSRDAHCLTDVGGNQLAAELLGKKPGPYGRTDLTPAKSTPEPRALAILLLQALAGYEDALADNSWRHDGTDNATGRYLRFLAATGYPLSDVETYAMSKETA